MRRAKANSAPAETLALADFATYQSVHIGSYLNEHFASGTTPYLRPVSLPGAIDLFLLALASGAFLRAGISLPCLRRGGQINLRSGGIT
jgi:hypothetical protein